MITDLQTNNQPEAQAELDRALQAFNNPVLQGVVQPAVNLGSPAPEQQEEELVEPELAEVDETETDEEEIVNEGFAAEFEKNFGLKPAEAVELFNQLTAFRDEQLLMRTWAVSPTEYDERMAAVREFYNTLPEDGREQFNNVDGAQAIWKHLVDNGKAKVSKAPTNVKTSRVSKNTPASKPKQEIIKRSEILSMSEEEYRRNLPRITKAFAEKRVVMDA